MKQLTQKLKSGEMSVQEVPPPRISDRMILVRNYFSLISSGTEGVTVRAARKGLIGKAAARPRQVKQVLDVLKTQGPVQTFRSVMKRLEAYSPLGYSSAGEVLEVGAGVDEFRAGDRVGCAGVGYANHAELIAVPVNLAVKLPPGADLKRAAYNTLGSIALQGIRQADLRLGETCIVIGLGLLGQLTCLMLRASGVRVAGVDIDETAVILASKHCTDAGYVRETPGIEQRLLEFTGGIGSDAVIITAGSGSLDPINFAGAVARKKARIVIVGDVPAGFERNPHFYRKELEVRMSCSYGPGRYDPEYEEKGVDYPVGYVRWTEKRNMEAFQQLIHSGVVKLDYLTTHTFDLDESPRAYDLILNRSEPFLGIIIQYGPFDTLNHFEIAPGTTRAQATVTVGFIGAGSYAQSHLLPNIPKSADVSLKMVVTATGTSSKRVAERFGFTACGSRADQVFGDEQINTVIISTRHDSHAEYVIRALENKKHVFVEKPLALREDDLIRIRAAYEEASARDPSIPLNLMVGYNRRFSPLSRKLRSVLGSGPLSMLYRINAGKIDPDSWIQDPETGGGRIIGEVCHFIDYFIFLSGSLPVRIYASALAESAHPADTVCLNLEFADGSIGCICYFSNGSRNLPKEQIEVYRSGLTGLISDFRELKIYSERGIKRRRLLVQDKGQKDMLKDFFRSIRSGGPSPIPFHELFAGSAASMKALESLRLHRSMPVTM
ncbi:bi-domain-containing oxidoreductase [bacterium]|nr:bi-domain-containing oxidoreductase [candidate division CSSED10-310 bacterium]